jgi:hypothetical protein
MPAQPASLDAKIVRRRLPAAALAAPANVVDGVGAPMWAHVMPMDIVGEVVYSARHRFKPKDVSI